MNIDEYAATEGRLRGCRICHHPLRTEIEAARRKGYSMRFIAKWVMSENATCRVADTNIRDHFDNCLRERVSASTIRTW